MIDNDLMLDHLRRWKSPGATCLVSEIPRITLEEPEERDGTVFYFNSSLDELDPFLINPLVNDWNIGRLRPLSSIQAMSGHPEIITFREDNYRFIGDLA